jgi:predicted nucleic acid-binding Zn ribbon protein
LLTAGGRRWNPGADPPYASGMPTYVYATIGPDGEETDHFEVVQSMGDAPLTEHPETGEPVRRVLTPPMIGGRHSSASEKRKMTDGNLETLGFTKYVKSDSGYDKVAGKGPDLSQIRKLAGGRGSGDGG